MNQTRSRILLLLLALAGAGLWWGSQSLQAPPLDLAVKREQRQLAQDLNLPSRRIIATSDAPPAGSSSLFDKHIARIGGVPFPFQSLLDSLRLLDRWDTGYVALLVPDGRSLRKVEASFEYPRVIVAAQLDEPQTAEFIAPLYSGRLYLGYVESVDEVEVISYNDEAGRFEYQLVSNYCAGCTPEIHNAPRALCLSCHQAGVPIFSQRPWQETNANPEVARRLAEQHGVNWLDAASTSYHGAMLSTQLLGPETFDELTDQANSIATTQRIWLDGCGESGRDCRRQLLMLGLLRLLEPGRFDPQAPETRKLLELQAQSWPAPGVPLANNDVANRNPELDRTVVDVLSQLANRAWAWLRSWADTSDQTAGDFALFQTARTLAAELDPLRLRAPKQRLDADSVFAVDGIAAMFSPADRRRILSWAEGDADRVLESVLSGELDELLQPQALNRLRVLQALALALAQAVPELCCSETSRHGPAVSEDLMIPPDSDLALFERYCFACHRGNPSPTLNFMAGDSIDEIISAMRRKARISQVLQWQQSGLQMPPVASKQREQLDAAIRAGAGHRERMRAFVENQAPTASQ